MRGGPQGSVAHHLIVEFCLADQNDFTAGKRLPNDIKVNCRRCERTHHQGDKIGGRPAHLKNLPQHRGVVIAHLRLQLDTHLLSGCCYDHLARDPHEVEGIGR